MRGEIELDIQLGLDVFWITAIITELGELQGILEIDFFRVVYLIFTMAV